MLGVAGPMGPVTFCIYQRRLLFIAKQLFSWTHMYHDCMTDGSSTILNQ